MANLSPEINQKIWNLNHQLLEIIDISKATEYTLLKAEGETNETIEVLDQLQTITEKAIAIF